MSDDDEIARRLDYVERAIRRMETAIDHLRDLIRADIASRGAGGGRARPANMPAAPARYRRAQFPDGPGGRMVDGFEMWAGDGTGWARVYGPPPAEALEELAKQ